MVQKKKAVKEDRFLMNKKRKIKLLLLLALLVIIVIAYVVLQKNPVNDENAEAEADAETYPVTEIDTKKEVLKFMKIVIK